MSHFLITLGAAAAMIAVTAPLAAIFLVSVASRHEESEHTLAGRAPGPITGAARRLLAYRAQTGLRSWEEDQNLRASSRSPVPMNSYARPGGRYVSSRPGRPAPARVLALPAQAKLAPAKLAQASPAIDQVAVGVLADASPRRRQPAGTHVA